MDDLKANKIVEKAAKSKGSCEKIKIHSFENLTEPTSLKHANILVPVTGLFTCLKLSGVFILEELDPKIKEMCHKTFFLIWT